MSPRVRTVPSPTVRVALVLIATACSTGAGHVDIGGTWQGTTVLPAAHATTLSVIQSGATISGGIVIADVLDQTFAGTFQEYLLTASWSARSGCEDWSGTFTVDAEGSEMSGPVLVDRSRCTPTASDGTGTITLFKR